MRLRAHLRFAAAIGAVLLCGAEEKPAGVGAPAAIHAGVGAWRLSEVGGKVDCTVELTDEAPAPKSPGGRTAKAAFACRQAFPALLDLATWSLDDKGEIVLADAAGKPLAVFAGQPGGGFEAKAAGGRVWRLEAVDHPRPVSMFNAWGAVL